MVNYLMNKNTPVLAYDLDEMQMWVLVGELLPYRLKDFVRTTKLDFDGAKPSHEDVKRCVHETTRFMDELRTFLRGRVLNFDRQNVKAILRSASLPTSLHPNDALTIVDAIRAVSMNDNFWVKKEGENITFDEVCLRKRQIPSGIYEPAIFGRVKLMKAEDLAAELATDGCFAKVWMSKGKTPILLKTDLQRTSKKGVKPTFFHTRAELLVSNILDTSNVSHVKYWKEEKDKILFAASECVSSDEVSHISAEEVARWCEHTGVDFLSFVEENFPEDFHRMVLVDCIFGNTDRHLRNWWFRVDAHTNKITSLGALMDHNNAFVCDELIASSYEEAGANLGSEIYYPTRLSFDETMEKYARYIGELEIDEEVLPKACKERFYEIKSMEDKETNRTI